MRSVKKRRARWPYFLGATLLVLVAGYAAYAFWFVKPTQAQIDAAIDSGDWSRVARLLRRSDLSSDNGTNLYRLGYAYYMTGESDRALDAFMKADDKGYQRAECRYYTAAIYAGQGNAELAMNWMNDAFDAGFSGQIEDRDLLALSKTTSWRQFFSGTQLGDPPVGEALDFMIGTWAASRESGLFGGGNVIVTRQLDGAILEDWNSESSQGSLGMFVFDKSAQRWSYTSIDGLGRVFEGQVTTGKQITVSGTMTYANGVEVLRRIVIRRSSSVVDYVVTVSRDNGKTWDEPVRRRLSTVGDGVEALF